MDRFGQAFTDAATQLSKVKQYYEFSWDDEAFGMTLPSMHGRKRRQMNIVKEFTTEWGLDSLLLAKSLKSYDLKSQKKFHSGKIS